jgi:uncharacterized protein DUF2357/PD-(D/E)XK nuclease superfamily protein
VAGLLLRDEKTRETWRIWPDPQAVPAGRIQETGSYLFELHDTPHGDAAVLLIDDAELEGLRPAGGAVAHWRWAPGFHAGTAEAELRLSGRAPYRFDVVTDTDRRKLTRDDFDAMVREILDDTFALFSLSSFRKGVGRGTGNRPPPIARLEFLRSRIMELEETARSIARAPRRTLAAENTELPYHRAVRATGPEILRSMRSGRMMRETHGGPTRLPAALQGFLPERIRLRQRRGTLDLPEHRQMAACLHAWSAWLGNAASMLARVGAPDDTELRGLQAAWSRRCRRLARRVGQLAELAPFAEAGEAHPHLMLSSLVRRDPAYRRFFRLYQDINLGIAAVFGDFLQMPLARTFELYELWCFLRLVRAGAEAYGPEGLVVTDLFISDAAGGVTIRTGAVTVPVGGGWKLCFQKQYREFWIEHDRHGSYSRVMVPDIVVAGDGEGKGQEPSLLIVLDAKYRVEDGLPDALNSIHTYKDALVHEVADGKITGFVRAAYLLVPLFPGIEGGYRETPMPGRLFHPEYRRAFRFGALTLRPGMSGPEITAALQAVVADATAT